MGIVCRSARFLANGVEILDQHTLPVDKSGKDFKVVPLILRILVCLLLMIFSSFYVVTESVIAGKTEETKDEVKQGIKDTKEEFKKMPEELKKAGKEMKKRSHDVKKNVEADVGQGKKNIQNITK